LTSIIASVSIHKVTIVTVVGNDMPISTNLDAVIAGKGKVSCAVAGPIPKDKIFSGVTRYAMTSVVNSSDTCATYNGCAMRSDYPSLKAVAPSEAGTWMEFRIFALDAIIGDGVKGND
jgi:hypothetical protein